MKFNTLWILSTQIRAGLGNPCVVLRQFRVGSNQVDEVETVVAMCQTVFVEQVTQPLNQWDMKQDGNQRAYSMVPQQPSLQQNPGQQHEAVADRPPPTQAGGQPLQPAQVGTLRQQPGATHLSNLVEEVLDRSKGFVTELVVGTLASNVLTTILDHYWRPDHVKQELLEADIPLCNLNRRQNFTELQVVSLREAGHNTAQLVEHNIAQISVIRSVFPSLAVVAGHIMARTHLLGANLERVWVSCKSMKLDLAALHSVSKFDPLLEVVQDSIVLNSLKLSSPPLDTFKIRFTARCKSVDTKVNQVGAFRYWTEGDGKPLLKEYAGQPICNHQTNCVQGIVQPGNSYVTVERSERNHYDQRLASWGRWPNRMRLRR